MVSQRELAEKLFLNGWKSIDYSYDSSRHDMAYSSVLPENFKSWWSSKGNKVWFRSDDISHIQVKFDYDRIQIWQGNSNPEKFERKVPSEILALLGLSV